MPLKTILSPVIYDVAVFFSFGEVLGCFFFKSYSKLMGVLIAAHKAIINTDENDDLGSTLTG